MTDVMYFGGVEGGATHSNLVICDGTGQVLGTASGPGTNHWTLGIEGCANRIVAMLKAAKINAGLPVDKPLDSLGLTLSGCEQESSNAELAARVKEIDADCARAIYVASDTAGSLFTGAPNGGMVLIAGTGSNALLRTPSGEQHGCGGWGFLLGDEGSAYWIAHRAVKTVFDDIDGLKPSPHPIHNVWEVIKEHFEADTRADLLPHAYKHFDKPQFASVTVKLAKLANRGDSLSQHLFAEAGSALAAHIAALAHKATASRLRVVCVGSVWNSWDALKPGVLNELHSRRVKLELDFVRLRVSSAMGAVWLAAKHVGFDLPRDDSAFCSVFYTYAPDCTNGINGTNGSNGVHGKCNGANGKHENVTCKVNGNMNGVTMNGEVCGCYHLPAVICQSSVIFSHLTKMSITKRFSRIYFNLKPVYNANYRCLSRVVPIFDSKNNWRGSNNGYVSIFAIAAGVLGYVGLKEKLFAAEPIGNELKGRREKYNFIADVVKVSAPSVVYIEIKDGRRLDLFSGQPITLSNGSGFIVKEDGLILTNAHVVVNKPNAVVSVRLMDGSTHTGFVEDVDMKSDLATLRIPVKGLPIMKLGSSADIKPGEWVVAMGSPLALSNTVTAGVVSSTQRASEELGLRGKDMVYIQTDAPITFGNSGGPLVNLDGEAIGINSMKVTSGISFAIPIDYVKDFLAKRTTKSPQVSRRYLGITMLSLTPNILMELRMRNPEMPSDIEHGILVWKVIIGSPAYNGGLQPGDIVTSINGIPVHSAADIYMLLEKSSGNLKVEAVRGRSRVTLTVAPEYHG
ncbi:uncharacterized protein LOC114351337 [Ostrinia furnacalis]|uniref:uncharacterized protein LOC114351337 n=1 Tax=Ostrinia furnacalis TaxID=93504 RepID=UPI00103BD6C2|nr:uncharacterized protein LOC114351337 [Ostrinia furnacalis]